MLRNMLMQKRF